MYCKAECFYNDYGDSCFCQFYDPEDLEIDENGKCLYYEPKVVLKNKEVVSDLRECIKYVNNLYELLSEKVYNLSIELENLKTEKALCECDSGKGETK